MLTNVGPRLTSKDLDAAEEALGLKLPAQYRSFLSKTNGGFVDGIPIVFFCVDTTPKNPVPFGPIAGSDCPPETTEIGWVNVDRIAAARLPAHRAPGPAQGPDLLLERRALDAFLRRPRGEAHGLARGHDRQGVRRLLREARARGGFAGRASHADGRQARELATSDHRG
jgi:hypothetical protein